jgi:hypothetical protein
VVFAVAALATVAAPRWWPTPRPEPRARIAPAPVAAPTRRPSLPPHDPAKFLRRVDTAHYAIASNATDTQTAQVAAAVESLHAAYAAFFAGALADAATAPRLQLALYRDRADFQAHNTSQPWAEAFYRRPVCHAYYGVDEANPVHWMLHEATHQLNTERAHFPRPPWVDEGLATYFATSRIDAGVMAPGELDYDTYPLWWLDALGLTGDRRADVRARRVIPLRELIENEEPPPPRDVNRTYVGYWSLTRYLLHGDGGRHAAAYRALVARGATIAEFERTIGPVEDIEAGWYAYLLEQVEDARKHQARRRRQ